MGQYKIKKIGRPRKYDRSKIKKGFIEGKSNSEIALEVGCTPNHIVDLRWRWERGSRRVFNSN